MLQEVLRTRSESSYDFLEVLDRRDVKEISEYLLDIHLIGNQDSISTRDWENIIFKKMIVAYLIA